MNGFLTSFLQRIVRYGWREALLLLVVLFVVGGTFLFIRLADEVKESETLKFDEWALRSLRRDDDPRIPIGPAWVREAGLDITALGSPVVLTLVVLAVLGFMLLHKEFGMFWLTTVTTAGGTQLAIVLKHLIDRGRPEIVPHLREVSRFSFPSGHAMLSTVVYLTLGISLLHVVRGRLLKLYCLIWAMCLAFLVGISRVYLGVHYPTDVLAGWLAGLIWALACWLGAQYLRHRRAVMKGEILETAAASSPGP